MWSTICLVPFFELLLLPPPQLPRAHPACSGAPVGHHFRWKRPRPTHVYEARARLLWICGLVSHLLAFRNQYPGECPLSTLPDLRSPRGIAHGTEPACTAATRVSLVCFMFFYSICWHRRKHDVRIKVRSCIGCRRKAPIDSSALSAPRLQKTAMDAFNFPHLRCNFPLVV